MSLASIDDLEDFLRSSQYKTIAGHEAQMTDTAASEWWTAIGMVLVNRVAHECATKIAP